MKQVLLALCVLFPTLASAQSVVITPATSLTCTDGQVPLKASGVWTCGAGTGTGTVTSAVLTSGALTKATGAGALANSICVESGTTLTCTGTGNFTSALQINGVGVVMPSTAPVLTGTNFTGIPAAGVTGTAAILGANTFTGSQVSTATGSAFAVIPSSAGAATYYVMDNTANVGGKRWRLGYTGASGSSVSSFDLYNQTDNVLAWSSTSAGNFTATGALAFGGGSAISSSSNVARLNTVNTFTGSIQTIDSADNALWKANRVSSAASAAVRLATAGAEKWLIGTRGDGSETFRFYSDASGTNVMSLTEAGEATFTGTLRANGAFYSGATIGVTCASAAAVTTTLGITTGCAEPFDLYQTLRPFVQQDIMDLVRAEVARQLNGGGR